MPLQDKTGYYVLQKTRLLKGFDKIAKRAVNKFYDAQEVGQLKPYCNFFDVIYSRYLNMGIDAERTIGIGCRTCRLEYKKNRATLVPERLGGILSGAK